MLRGEVEDGEGAEGCFAVRRGDLRGAEEVFGGEIEHDGAIGAWGHVDVEDNVAVGRGEIVDCGGVVFDALGAAYGEVKGNFGGGGVVEAEVVEGLGCGVGEDTGVEAGAGLAGGVGGDGDGALEAQVLRGGDGIVGGDGGTLQQERGEGEHSFHCGASCAGAGWWIAMGLTLSFAGSFGLAKERMLEVHAVRAEGSNPFVACSFALTLGELMPSQEVSCGMVLVVDDDVIIRELLRAVLGMEGYEVLLAASGEEALVMLAREGTAIDVILMDLHLPDVKAAELARRLEAGRAAETLLVGMSGSRLNPTDAELFRSFLQKPFSGEDFSAAVTLARAGKAGGTELVEMEDGAGRPVLDEEIYRRLAAMMPVAQLRELYRITVEDVLQRVLRMRDARERGDMEEYRAEAHAIKGGCGMVGASELSGLATVAERSVAGGSERDNPSLADFDAACTRLQGMLDARI